MMARIYYMAVSGRTGRIPISGGPMWVRMPQSLRTSATDPLIKRAVTEGLDPAGNPMDWTMPRWRMAPEDFEDFVAFLKSLR